MEALSRICGYELRQRLGGSSLTCVYAARHCASGSSYALKTLSGHCADKATAVKLLQREARAGLSVRNRHLARYVDAHVLTSPYFLVMELLSGESVKERLRRDARLDTATALGIAHQTAEALAALHRGGFVHGDVKPDN